MKKLLVNFLRGTGKHGVAKQKKIFKQIAKQIQAQEELPSPELIADVLQTYAKIDLNTYKIKLFGCHFTGNEATFFIQSTWIKICEAIEAGQPIIEVGSARSCFLALAALCGADCIGIEAPKHPSLTPTIINPLSAIPQAGVNGSFQMYHMRKPELLTVSDSGSEIEFYTQLNKQGEIPALLHSAQQEPTPGRPITSGFSNQSAIQVLKEIEHLLPNGKKLDDALVLCSMPPHSVYGMGYLFNRLQDRGSRLLLWVEDYGAVSNSTPVWPSINRHDGITWLSALDQSRALTAGENCLMKNVFTLAASGTLTPKDQQNIARINSKQARWGFAGHDLDCLHALRTSLDLCRTPDELGYVNVLNMILPSKHFYPEPGECSRAYKETGLGAKHSPASSATTGIFSAGKRVKIHSLGSKAGQKLNGLLGKVVGPAPKAPNRFAVRLLDSVDNEPPRTLSIKPENLSLAP